MIAQLSYNGLRPSARQVDSWACWALPAGPKLSIVSEEKEVICMSASKEKFHILSTDVVKL